MNILRALTLLIPLTLGAEFASAGALFTWGTRVSSPQLLSVSGGIVIGPIDAPPPPPPPPDAPVPKQHLHVPSGLLIQLEPGVGGGKVGLGFVKGLPPVAAGGIQAFFLRTWGAPLWNETKRSYVGVEMDATLFLKLSLGVMRRVGDTTHDTKVTGGIGIGF